MKTWLKTFRKKLDKYKYVMRLKGFWNKKCYRVICAGIDIWSNVWKKMVRGKIIETFEDHRHLEKNVKIVEKTEFNKTAKNNIILFAGLSKKLFGPTRSSKPPHKLK